MFRKSNPENRERERVPLEKNTTATAINIPPADTEVFLLNGKGEGVNGKGRSSNFYGKLRIDTERNLKRGVKFISPFVVLPSHYLVSVSIPSLDFKTEIHRKDMVEKNRKSGKPYLSGTYGSAYQGLLWITVEIDLGYSNTGAVNVFLEYRKPSESAEIKGREEEEAA